nr:hypothetical protein [Oedogonium sp. BN3]
MNRIRNAFELLNKEIVKQPSASVNPTIQVFNKDRTILLLFIYSIISIFFLLLYSFKNRLNIIFLLGKTIFPLNSNIINLISCFFRTINRYTLGPCFITVPKPKVSFILYKISFPFSP